MRQIGTLPREVNPRIFGDYLLARGIKSRIDESATGWIVWVHDEDQVAKGAEELRAYLADPGDPKFSAAAAGAKAVRREEQRQDREYRKNLRDVNDQWTGLQARRRPLTVAVVGISIVVFLLGQMPGWGNVYDVLRFTIAHRIPGHGLVGEGLAPIRSGQIWRLVTPIFLHFGLPHIVFNSWATTTLGTLIEKMRGTRRFAVLVLVSAVVSNLGQYLYMAQSDPSTPAGFGGLSGVVYSLFGYLWMKSIFEPEQGVILSQSTVNMMLIWLVLCMTGILGNIANAAHVVGLVVGVAFGLLRF